MSAQTPGMPGLAQGASYFTTAHGSESRTTSAPGTPRPTIDTEHAPSSPALQRRASAQFQRPGSSLSPRLNRKPSRSSLGSPSITHDESQRRPTPKRSISNLITELRGAQATMEAIPEPVVLTASEIAAECFRRELASHDETAEETVVLLHDACYGHRYSRLKTTKSTLSMIVERPERLLASVLGVAATYVRLGGYHAGERNAPHPKHTPSRPPFTIRRTARTLDIKSTFVTNVHGKGWMSELNSLCEVAGTRLAVGEKEITRLTSSAAKDTRSLHEGDLYLCQESLDAFQGALGGVADAVDAVFLPTTYARRAFVAVRPPGHHCSADYPSGFCWINNVHVGIEYAAQLHDLTHAAIIDFDLHHGDGSQSIAWTRNSNNNAKRLFPKAHAKTKVAPDIGYYSLHDINSYPCEMGDDEKIQAASLCIHNAHGQSIWNVHLQPWKTVEEFWALYESRYHVLLDKAREFLQHHTARIQAEGKQRPKAAIFISAGFDASEYEGEGMQRHKVNVPTDFYARITEDIIKVAEEASTSCDGRIISVLEGGYSDRALCSSTMSHLSALCNKQTVSRAGQGVAGGLGASMHSTGVDKELDQRMQGLSLVQQGQYDAAWWSAANLSALELHVNPPPPSTTGGKKIRAGPQPTYATPTESFAYKVIDPAKFARSVSGTMREGSAPTRPMTPPPPEVDWIVATHELSKLLIPTHRSTRSHTAEDLAGAKTKKDRASSAEMAPSPDELGKPRQLRTRGKAMAQTSAQVSKRAASSADRRKTMADLPSAAAEVGPTIMQPRRASRRSSMASTISNISTLPDSTVPPMPPITSQRPAIPSSVANGSVQVKKTRVAPATPAAKSKKSAITATPRTPSAAVTELSTTSNLVPPVGSSTDALIDPGVDALASGMKRISLELGAREESERKAKEKLDADRRARALKGAETRRLNKAAKDAKEAQEKAAMDASNSRPLVQQSAPFHIIDQSAAHAATQNAHQTNAQPQMYNSAMQDANAWQHYQTQTGEDMKTINVAHYPSFDGTNDNNTTTPQDGSLVSYEQAMILPDELVHNEGGLADTFYPSQYATSNLARNLPVFTSTGHIPFAKPGHVVASRPQQHDQESGLHHPLEQGVPPETMACRTGDQIRLDTSQRDTSFGQSEVQSLHAYDVWAVPDTPSKQLYDPER